MNKFRTWLIASFLPGWAVAEMRGENTKLKAENAALSGEVRELKAYIRGLENSLRAMRRITINTGEGER